MVKKLKSIWEKVPSCVEWLGLGLSVLAIILLIIIFVLFISVKYNFVKESPIVIAGLSAALIAFLGVVVSQVWQSSNTNKNIRSTQENADKQIAQQQESLKQQNANLSKQLKSQQKSLDKQLKAQQENLEKQLQSASELQDKKFDGEREKYQYEYHKEAQKEMFIALNTAHQLIPKLISSYFSLQQARCNYRWNFIKDNKEEADKFELLQDKSLKEYNQISLEKDNSIVLMNFHRKINDIADEKKYINFMEKYLEIHALITKMGTLIDDYVENSYKRQIDLKESSQTLLNLDDLSHDAFELFECYEYKSIFSNVLDSINYTK